MAVISGSCTHPTPKTRYTFTYANEADGKRIVKAFELSSFFKVLEDSTCQAIAKAWKNNKPVLLENNEVPTEGLVHVTCKWPAGFWPSRDFVKVSIDFAQEIWSQEVNVKETLQGVAYRIHQAQQKNAFICLSDGSGVTLLCRGTAIAKYSVEGLSSPFRTEKDPFV